MPDQTVSIIAVLQDKFSVPLAKMENGISKIGTSVSNLGKALSPVINGFTALAGAVGAGVSIQKSLEAAEQAVRAEDRLLKALRGRTLEMEKILKLTDDLQKTTRFEDEGLKEAAATLLNMGIAAEDIPKTLQAAVDTSAAFGLEMDTVIRSIGQFSEGGSGTLGRFIPQIKKLGEEGKLASEGVDFLAKSFAGAAAVADSDTFGKIEQAEHRIGESAETIGKGFATLKLKIIQALEPIVAKIADFVGSKGFQVLVDTIGKLLPMIAALGAALSAIFAAGLAIKVAVFLAPVIEAITGILSGLAAVGVAIGTFLISPIGLATAAIVGLIVLVGELSGAFESIGKIFSDLGDAFGEFIDGVAEVFNEVKDGQLTVADLFDFVFTKIKQVLEVLKVYIFNPVVRFAKAIFNTIVGLIGTIAFTIITTWTDILLKLAKLFDKVFKTDLVSGLKTFTDAMHNSLADSEQLLTESFPDAIADTAQDIALLGDTIEKSQRELEERQQASRQRQIKVKKDNAQKEIDIEKQKNAALLAEQAVFEAQLAKQSKIKDTAGTFLNLSKQAIEDLIKSVDLTSIDATKGLIMKDLDDQLRRERISVEQFLDLKETAERGFAARQAKQIDDDITKNQEKLKVLKTQLNVNDQTKEGLQKQVDVNGKIRDIEKTLVDLGVKRNELTLKEIASEQALRDTRLQLAAKIKDDLSTQAIEPFKLKVEGTMAAISEGTVSIASGIATIHEEQDKLNEAFTVARDRISKMLDSTTDPKLLDDLKVILREFDKLTAKTTKETDVGTGNALVQQIQEARTKLNEFKQEQDRLFSEGAITKGTRDTNVNSALAQFTKEAEEAKDAIHDLAAAAPEAADELGALGDKVNDIQLKPIGGQKAKGDDFFTAMIAGAQQTTEELGNLQNAGLEAGKTLTNDLADGLVNVFVKGQQTFKEFVAQFLQGIASMIAKLLIMKALEATIALVNTGGEIMSGGGVRRMAFGGEVPGPNVNRDVINALLTPKEYVMPTHTTDFYGMRAMRAIHAHAVPRDVLASYGTGSGAARLARASGRYATGGEVTKGGGSFGAPSKPTPATILAGPQEMDRFLAGGTGALERHFRDNRPRFRASLGI